MSAEVAVQDGAGHAAGVPGTGGADGGRQEPSQGGATAKAARARAPRADARRNNERLLAAALQAFADRGADDASLEEIARRAGVGIGTLYRHFPTRQALLEAVYRDQVNALGARAAELAMSQAPGAALAEWVAALVAFGKTKRSLTTALLEVLDKDSALLSSSRTILGGATDVLVERAQRAGVVRAGVLGADVLRLAHGVSMAADTGQDPGQADRMLALVIDGLLGPPTHPAR